MDSYIDKKLDEFFEKDSPRYMEMSIFEEVFKRVKELENTNQSLYTYELKRVSDLKCCIDTAREDGKKRGLEESKRKIEVAKNAILQGLNNEIIAKLTNLSIEEIKRLRNK